MKLYEKIKCFLGKHDLYLQFWSQGLFTNPRITGVCKGCGYFQIGIFVDKEMAKQIQEWLNTCYFEIVEKK